MGTSLLRLQLRYTTASSCILGEIRNDYVCSTRFWTGFCLGGRFLWFHLSRMDGEFPLVGHRNLQTGKQLLRSSAEESADGESRVVIGRLALIKEWHLGSLLDHLSNTL